MRYENRQPAEGINTTDEHPLKEFTQLLIAVTLIVALVITVLHFSIGWLARYIPFHYEQNMVQHIDYLALKESPQQRELQALAQRMAAQMQLPDDITLTLHYDDDDMVNAFATLGGHIVFFKGLLDSVESEQELAAVMAHEIAHVKLRHPIVAMGKGVTLATLAAVVSGSSASAAGNWLIGSSVNFGMMRFSRQQELAADALAAHALYKEYGNISGLQLLFERFAEIEQGSAVEKVTMEAFRSHPYSANRWQALLELAEQHQWPINSAVP